MAMGIPVICNKGVGDVDHIVNSTQSGIVVNDFNDLLAGLDAFDDFFAKRFFFHTLDEIASDLEIHIRFQQRHANFAQRIANIIFRNLSQSAQISKCALEFFTKRIEHGTKLKLLNQSAKEKRPDIDTGDGIRHISPLKSALVGYPSGQRGQTVNLLAYAFDGSNPSPTTTPVSSYLRAKIWRITSSIGTS